MFIRQANADDTAIIHDIGCRSYRSNFTNIWTPTGLENHLQKGFNPEIIQSSLNRLDSELWLLISTTQSDPPIGFAMLKKDSPIPVQSPNPNKPSIEIQKLYFLPEASGQGKGKQLMDFALNFAKESGYPIIWLDVLKSNEGAIRFYEANGFEQVGQLAFKTDCREVGQWVMVKKLKN